MMSFALRNLRVFFRDRSAVFFSLLSSLIIIGLYFLFLGDVWADNFDQMENARDVIDNWVMAGLLSITSLTTTLGAFGSMVEDRTKKLDKDFYTSPISRRRIGAGYVISAYIIGFVLCVFTLVLAELYIVAKGGTLLSPDALLKVLGLILLTDLSNTALVFLLTTFFASMSAFSVASTVIGTMIGFLTGIYLPVGFVPEAVQWVIKLFPPSYGAALMRQVMMEAPLTEAAGQIPPQYLSDIKDMLGVTLKLGDSRVSPTASVLVLLATGAVFFALAVLNLARKKK